MCSTNEQNVLSFFIALYGVFRGVCGILECKTISPIYTKLVHDGKWALTVADTAKHSPNQNLAVCMNTVNGLTWLFSSTVLFAFFSMTMFCLRAAMYPVKFPDMKRYQRPSAGRRHDHQETTPLVILQRSLSVNRKDPTFLQVAIHRIRRTKAEF